jgi:RHS repeat-associated protein
MRGSRCLLLFIPLLIALCGIPASSQNQDPPGVAMGINPQGTYHGGDFDSVDMSTGRLNLRIPLVVDKSQRGDLNFTYSVTYTSTGIWSKFSSTGNPGTWVLVPPPYSVSSPGLITEGWLFPVKLKSQTNPMTGYRDYVYWVPEDVAFVGPIHPFGESETIDGSGIGASTPNADTVVNRKGVRFVYDTNGNFLSVEDPNGNVMSSSNGNNYDIKDTLGRSWTISSISSDVTRCPTGGPVAPIRSYTWTIPGPANVNSGVRVFKLCFSDYYVNASMQGYPYPQPNIAFSLMTGLVLPDGTTWRFDYDNNSFADLTAVYTPTGGSVQYTWTTANGPSCNSANDVGLRVISTRTVNDGINSPQQWTYFISGNIDQGGGTVRDPLGNDTVYTAQCEGPITQVKYYLGHSDTGQLLKTENKDYRFLPNPYPNDSGAGPVQESPLLQTITTIWPSGQQNQIHLGYDSFTFTDLNPDNPLPSTYTSSYGLVTSETHSDYGNGSPGPIISATNTNYKALSNPSYLNANILDLPISVIVNDVNGNKCAETDYGYDASAQIVPSGIGTSQQHMGPPTPGVLGNLTSISRQVFNNPCSLPNPSSTLLTTNRYVYDTGMLQKSVDPRLNPTTYSYSSTYYGAFPTTITNALNQSTGFGYDFNTGFLTSTTDANQQATQYSPDCMMRPVSISYPDGGQEGVTYNYSGGAPCSGATGLTYTGATQTKKINSSLTLSQNSLYDGLGRLKQTQLTSDPEGVDYNDTTYDADGRLYSVSNPYRTTSDPTYGITKYQYDPLNRITTIIEQDLSAIGTTYSGNCTTVTDEAGRSRRSCTDGLQRLTEVDDYSAPTAVAKPGSGWVTTSGSEKSFTNSGGSGSHGPNAVGTGADGGGGNASWSNPNNITLDNSNSPASSSITGALSGGSQQSNILNATRFGFSLPSTTTSINGIQVTVTRRDPSNVCLVDNSALLLKAGSVVGTDHSTQNFNWSSSYTAVNYGGSTDTWGASWTYSDINNSGFGFQLSVFNNCGATETAQVIFVQITVWYTTAAGTTYDSGTAWVTLNGSPQIPVTYGQGDTPYSLGGKLVQQINATSSLVKASRDSSCQSTSTSCQVDLQALAAGANTNYSLAAPPSSSSNGFSPPSFTVSVSGSSLTGGGDVGGTLTASTFYQYDALGNLIRVDQKNGDANSADWRTRLFAYDSLSRLQQATNPESGTICYGTYSGSTCQLNGYDANSNLVFKTDARGVVTTFTYDALNRLTQKSYSDGLTATTKYGYDAIAPTGCSPSLTMAYPIGRRTAMCDAAGNEAWSYDVMGRPVTDQRTTNGITKTTSYYKTPGVLGYNFDGSIALITYPSGRTVTYTPSPAARMLSAVDTANSINYATSALYTAGGALRSLTNGTAHVYDYFNSRLQPCRFAVNTSGTTPTSCADTNKGNILDLTYNFGLGADNGNVLGITNNITAGRSLTAAYDMLNRIESAYTSTWSEQYGMDLWGNLTAISAMPGKPAGENLSQSATTQNRFTGMNYDVAGNLLNDGSTAYAFDAESRIRTAGTATYLYDGDGKRVEKSTSSGVYKIYWYGMNGDPLDETDGTGSLTNTSFNEYVFFNGKRIARRDGSGNVFYYFTDHLGTSREIVQAGQTSPCYDADFYPFGRESTVYTNTCPQNYKFTGKERDETGLDDFGARYYTSQYARFMTPDWAAKATAVPYADFGTPQSLNLYGYVKNNPLSYADPDGHCDWCDNAFDFSFGIVRGAASSISFGAMGSPRSTDTDASRLGQMVGSGVIGAVGEITSDAGKGAVALGLAGELPSAGTSTVVVVAGAGATALGTAAEAGAAANLAKIVGAPMQAGFTQNAKDAARANAGGKCEYCGKETVPGQQSQKGVTPPGNEGQTDHYDPVSKGGSNDPSNAVHACRDCNQAKSNTSPRDTRWQLPRKKDDNN